MYLFLCIFFLLVGLVMLIVPAAGPFAPHIQTSDVGGRPNKPLLYMIRISGGVLVVAGLVLLYLVLAGKLVLPLH